MIVVYRPAALDDIDQIIEYFRRHASSKTPERFVNKLLESIKRIQAMPSLGARWRTIRSVNRPIRFIPVQSFKKWLIFFSTSDTDEIVIHRVLHSAMNLRKLLGRS